MDGICSRISLTDHKWLAALPHDWQTQVAAAGLLHGRDVVKKGRGPGSLEDETTAGLDYRVVTGDEIQRNLPWLWGLYRSRDLVLLVREVVGEPVLPSSFVESAITINYLAGRRRYEWHLDAQPYVAILFATTHPRSEGGALLLGDRDKPIAIPPIAGDLVIFDGSAVPHAVEPLAKDGVRISIPMVYVPERLAESRPPGLDRYLFTDRRAAGRADMDPGDCDDGRNG